MSATSSSHSHSQARVYNDRVLTYDTFWHSNFVKTIPSYFPKLPSKARILDLVCGTGCSTCALADQFEDASLIIGVVMSPGKLDKTQMDVSQMADGRVRDEFYEHDILDLDSLAAVQDGAFDVTTCVSAFELLPDLYEALAHWRRYLAPGGIVAFHATHPIAGLAFERTASELDVSLPYSFSWSGSEEELRDTFKKTDLEVLSVKLEHPQD